MRNASNPRRHFPRLFSRKPEIEHSLRHSVKDGVAYSVMTGAGEAYFSAFAVYLKATPSQIGLLAALPQLVASLAQLLSAWLGHRTTRRKSIILVGASLQGYSWLPLILLPVLLPNYAVPLLLLAVTLYYFGANLAIPQWISLMGDLVPKRRRGRYFAYRTRLASITSFFALISAGLILHLSDKDGHVLTGFVSIFVIAMTARFVSIHHLKKMHEPPGHTASLEISNWRLWKNQFQDSAFARFSIFFAFMQFATAIASPFFSVYLLRDLGLSYLQFTLNMGTVIMAQFLTLNWWGRLADTFGNRRILIMTGCVIPLLPALWMVSTNIGYLMILQAIGGLAWAGFSLSASNFIYDALPAHKRITLMAAHNTLANIGVFFGAMLGGFIATEFDGIIHIGTYSYEFSSVFFIVFILSTLVRCSVSLLFLPRLKEVRHYKPMPVRELFFRVARFNALWGVFFDVVSSRRKKKPQQPSQE